MRQGVGEFLSRHKHGLTWLHIAGVVGTLCLLLPAIGWLGGPVPTPARALLVFGLATLAWCQNIGLVHQGIHHRPRGSRWLGRATVRFLHYLVGLPYVSIRLAHHLHHAYLGTARDPDRAGYETTTTLATRLRYLILIGPLRARFAPVDIRQALDAMAPGRRQEYHRLARRDRRLVVATHLGLIALYGWYYPIVFAALLAANVLSNLREMAEHGTGSGSGAYVDLRLSPLGVLFVSTPGFWFHGQHHMAPSVHYLDLPLAAQTRPAKRDRPYLRRASAVAYLLSGR